MCKKKDCPGGCGKKIQTRSKFCHSCGMKGSLNHRWKSIGLKRCLDCGSLSEYPGMKNRKRCRACYSKWHKGVNHHSWKGGKNQWKCIDCGKQRFNFDGKRCNSCYRKFTRGVNHPGYKERKVNYNGYIYVGAGDDRIFEHRLIMEKHLKRKLKESEIVHHLNGIRDDNRIENLEVTTRQHHEPQTYIKILQQRIRELEKKTPT